MKTLKKLAANVIGHKWTDALITDAIHSQPVRRRGRPQKNDKFIFYVLYFV